MKEIRNYIKVGIALVLLAVSIRPLLFTWNFMWAGYHLKKDKYAAGAHMARALSYKPAVLEIFDKYAPGLIEYYLVKSAILKNDKKMITTYSHLVPPDRINTRYEDNFYYRDMLGELDRKREWRHLDEVSFEMLSTEPMNPRTRAIFTNIFQNPAKKTCVMDRDRRPPGPGKLQEKPDEAIFIENLVDFAIWKGNPSLSRYITAAYIPGRECFDSMEITGWDYEESGARLKQILEEKYKLRAKDLGANEIPCPGFTWPTCISRYWYFSEMAGGPYFSRGSFVMGMDRTGKDRNPVLRIMGFFEGKDPGKSPPRAGVRSRRHIPAENGFYVVGIDYMTVTGRERPTIYLGKNLEQHLPPTRQQWKKAILIVNNAFNAHESFNPLVRVWGTGTMLVDNVYLAKVTDLKFSITEPWVVHIATIQH